MIYVALKLSKIDLNQFFVACTHLHFTIIFQYRNNLFKTLFLKENPMKTTTYLFKKLLVALTLIVISTSGFAADIDIKDARVRAVPAGQVNSAAFMMLQNNSSENRLLVSASSNISKVVELHTHKKEGGMMRMRQVDSIAIKAGSKTVLKPGGLHIMFIGLNQGLKAGENVDLKLVFDNGSEIELKVPVKMVAGMQKKMMQHK